jgi:hypothetical protein
MSSISRKTRPIALAVGERYRTAKKVEKSKILSEFVALSGYHPKHAVRVMNHPPTSAQLRGGGRPRVYEEGVKQAPIVLWEASGRVCGKRLKPLLPLLVDSMERHGHLHLDPAIRTRVLSVSASTIDRILAEPRAQQPGRRKGRKKPLIGKQIQVRTFADWNEPQPGHMDAHTGERDHADRPS